MSLRSVYVPVPAIEHDQIRLTGDEHRHLIVSRSEKGEVVEIFDGSGSVWTALIVSVNKRETVAHVQELRQAPPPSVDSGHCNDSNSRI